MTELYKPPGSKTLAEMGDSQIRLGIQGEPFSGKTTSSLTFPNVVNLSFDKKLTAHRHRSDVLVVPFYDDAFVDSIVRRDGVQAPANRRDAFLVWLQTEGINLSPKQSLVIDGGSAVDEAYHRQYRLNPAISNRGEENKFAEFKFKMIFFEDIHSALKAVPANVVFLFHETPERDKKGDLTGKYRVLVSGQSGDKLGGNFTDWFRSTVQSKPTNVEQEKKLMEFYNIDSTTLQEWISSTPDNYPSIHLWQVQGDEFCDCGTSSMFGAPKFVVANYSSFQKYQKK